jgi:cysteine sulfinate desulfinase/cysteine desulfurase-like protein
MQQIYLDNNATTRIDPRVAKAMYQSYLAGYVNPASPHQLGREARRVLEDTRDNIGRILGGRVAGVQADRVIFTSGGTEANNLALLGLAGREPGRVIISAIEHPSLMGPAELEPVLSGGFQQMGLRPGTEPLVLAVGFCRALELWHDEAAWRAERMQRLRDRLEATILAEAPPALVNGADAPRLPHTTNIAFPGLDRQAILMALDLAGVACSTGSACASGSSEPSPVLQAMGLSRNVVESSLRISVGADTTEAEIEESISRILNVINNLRQTAFAR